MIRKVLITGFLFFAVSLVGFCYSEDDLAQIELRKYGQTFVNDSLSDRLIRLETDMFGMSQSGDIDSRINLINQMNGNSSYSSIAVPEYNYSYGNKKGFFRNLFDTFSTGTMTGFTPPMTGYSSNYGNYCQYNNYNRLNKPFENRYYSRNYNNHRHNFPHRPPRIGAHNPYNTYNPYGAREGQPTYGSTNVITGSRVHILKDWFYTIKKRTLVKFSSSFLILYSIMTQIRSKEYVHVK